MSDDPSIFKSALVMASTVPALSQLVGTAARMERLAAAFERHGGRMGYKDFESTMREHFGAAFPEHPTMPTSGVQDLESVATTEARTRLRNLGVRQRRVLARMEVAGAVAADPLRLLFNRIDTRSVSSVTWNDFLAYVVEEASSAGVVAAVRDEFRAYTHSRTRHALPLPDPSLTEESAGAGLRASPTRDAASPLSADSRRRQELLRYVWRGHTNRYGGKLVRYRRGSQATGKRLRISSATPHGGHDNGPKDLVQIEFLDALPTNPHAFAVCCRHRPLCLYSKATLALLRSFSEAELGHARPTLVTYVAESDALLVYAAESGTIRGFVGLFSSSHVSNTAVLHVSAGILRAWRQAPAAMTTSSPAAPVTFRDAVFIGGSHGSVQQLRVPRRYRGPVLDAAASALGTAAGAALPRTGCVATAVVASSTAAAGGGAVLSLVSASVAGRRSPETAPATSAVPTASTSATTAGAGHALRVERVWDKLHAREAGGVLDFAVSDTHLFTCGFDHRIVSVNLVTGARCVIGEPAEAIHCLRYSAAFHLVIAVSLSSGKLLAWDGRAMTVVPPTSFLQGGSGDGGGSSGGGGGSAAAGGVGGSGVTDAHRTGGGGGGDVRDPATAAARVIGVECPLDLPHIITADSAGTVRVWDLRSRMCVQRVRADGACETAELADADTIYGTASAAGGADERDRARLAGTAETRRKAGAARRRAAMDVGARVGFDLSPPRSRLPKDDDIATRTAAGNHFGASGGAPVLGSRVSVSGQEISGPHDARAGEVPVLVSLAYFGETREIVTCTTDTIFCLRHHQCDDPQHCDVDVVEAVAHATRAPGARGALLLRGPSRLTLWDAASGYRTRVLDRALDLSTPLNRREIVAACLDDMGNRVFLSFPDGSVEVHDLRAAFENRQAGAAPLSQDAVVLAAATEHFLRAEENTGSGVLTRTVVAGPVTPRVQRSVTTVVEIVADLVYLTDHKLLLGATTRGRLFMRSEDEHSTFCTFVQPAPPEAPLENLAASSELGLAAYSAVFSTEDARNAMASPVSRGAAVNTNAPSNPDVTPDNTSAATVDQVGKQHHVFLFDFTRTGAASRPAWSMTVMKPVEGLAFLADLPLLLSVHPAGDLVFWTCPPVRGGCQPIISMNAFTRAALADPTAFFPDAPTRLRTGTAQRPLTGCSSKAALWRSQHRPGARNGSATHQPTTTARDAIAQASAGINASVVHRTHSPAEASQSTSFAGVWSSQTTASARGRCASRPASALVARRRKLKAVAAAEVNGATTRAAPPSSPSEEKGSSTSVTAPPPERERNDVTAVAFDGVQHRLFLGDACGCVHVFSLCPVIQAYGLRPCRLESRRPHRLATTIANCSPYALPALRRIIRVHGDVEEAAHGVFESGPRAVLALSWLPFLRVLVSSGEDRRVAMLDADGGSLGLLSAARLPPNLLHHPQVVDENRRWQPPYTLPPPVPLPLPRCLAVRPGQRAGREATAGATGGTRSGEAHVGSMDSSSSSSDDDGYPDGDDHQPRECGRAFFHSTAAASSACAWYGCEAIAYSAATSEVPSRPGSGDWQKDPLAPLGAASCSSFHWTATASYASAPELVPHAQRLADEMRSRPLPSSVTSGCLSHESTLCRPAALLKASKSNDSLQTSSFPPPLPDQQRQLAHSAAMARTGTDAAAPIVSASIAAIRTEEMRALPQSSMLSFAEDTRRHDPHAFVAARSGVELSMRILRATGSSTAPTAVSPRTASPADEQQRRAWTGQCDKSSCSNGTCHAQAAGSVADNEGQLPALVSNIKADATESASRGSLTERTPVLESPSPSLAAVSAAAARLPPALGPPSVALDPPCRATTYTVLLTRVVSPALPTATDVSGAAATVRSGDTAGGPDGAARPRPAAKHEHGTRIAFTRKHGPLAPLRSPAAMTSPVAGAASCNRPMPGTSEALRRRVDIYERELKRCLQGSARGSRSRPRRPSEGLILNAHPFCSD